MTSLQESDREAAAVAKAPRVSLADIEAAIAQRFDTTGDRIAMKRLKVGAPIVQGRVVEDSPLETIDDSSLRTLSVCLLVMRNGFTIIGKSAPASAENFNAELGRKLAYEDAIRQLWPLMGFALRDKLATAAGKISPTLHAAGAPHVSTKGTELDSH